MAIDREKIQANAQKFVEKKKYDKAVAELQRIVAEYPDDARTLLKIGDLQSKMGVCLLCRASKFVADRLDGRQWSWEHCPLGGSVVRNCTED